MLNQIKLLFNRILFYISPPKCVCCNAFLDFGDNALCKSCFTEFWEIKNRGCSKCSRLLAECDCSSEYLKAHRIKKLVKVFRYTYREENLPANSLIYSLKRDNRKDVLDLCAAELAKAIATTQSNPQQLLFTNVPRRKAAIVEYGIDHSALLAKRVAKLLGAKYEKLLVSKTRKPQKQLKKEERLTNVKIKSKKNLSLKSKRIIIVDDIVTTGASMAAAGAALRSLGAQKITGAAMAIAYRDEMVDYTPF